jgi:hypothetical protein
MAGAIFGKQQYAADFRQAAEFVEALVGSEV